MSISTALFSFCMLWLLLPPGLSAASQALPHRSDRVDDTTSIRLPGPGVNDPRALLSAVDTTDVDTNNYPVDQTLSDFGIPVLTLLIAVPIHELGHYFTAKAFGSPDVSIEFFPPSSGVPAIAVTKVDPRGITPTELGVIAIAGGGASRLLAESMHLVARAFDHRMTFPTFPQKLTSALFIYGRMDFPLYLVSDIFSNLTQQPGGDMDILVTQIAGRATLPRIGTYLGLLAVAALDLYLDLDRIGYHYSILRNKQLPHPSTGSTLRLGPIPGSGGLGASYIFSF